MIWRPLSSCLSSVCGFYGTINPSGGYLGASRNACAPCCVAPEVKSRRLSAAVWLTSLLVISKSFYAPKMTIKAGISPVRLEVARSIAGFHDEIKHLC